jgi:hypothetical protein
LNLINPSITQRLNGLTEKTDVTTDGKPIKSENITIRISNPLEDID